MLYIEELKGMITTQQCFIQQYLRKEFYLQKFRNRINEKKIAI
jgi:hypothetical protein